MSKSILRTFIKLESDVPMRTDDIIIDEPDCNIWPVLPSHVGKIAGDSYVLREIDMFDFIQQTKMEFINTNKIRGLSKETNDAKTLRIMIDQLCSQLDIIYR